MTYHGYHVRDKSWKPDCRIHRAVCTHSLDRMDDLGTVLEPYRILDHARHRRALLDDALVNEQRYVRFDRTRKTPSRSG
jgi:hypothetical protein